jgi:hypothetical protein
MHVYVEQSAVPEFDWVGFDSGFDKWTQPDVPTSERERLVILDRLKQWCDREGIKINFGAPANFGKRSS